MAKYIDAEKLKESLKRRYTDITVPVITSEGGLESYFRRREIRDIIKLIDSLQQEQPEKYIELNGIKYRKVPAKTNDKICKDCDYFLDSGTCKLVDCCPCVDDDTILERLQEQPEVDLGKELKEWSDLMVSAWFPEQDGDFISEEDYRMVIRQTARRFFELGLKAKEENK